MVRVATLIVLGVLSSAVVAGEGTVKVFLLTGQSNMEGKGAVNTLEWLGEDSEHGHLLQTIRTENGEWREGDDVWIDYLGRRGKLGVGYGSKGGAHGPKIGPEYGFGMVVGERQPLRPLGCGLLLLTGRCAFQVLLDGRWPAVVMRLRRPTT